MTPDIHARLFPWREILGGSATGWDAATLRARCGEPDQWSGDGQGGAILVYRNRRHERPDALSDPRATEVQAWLMGGYVALVAIRLEFEGGLAYVEVIGRGAAGA